MNLSESILGSGTVAKLREREEGAVLVIGSDHLTRGELAAVGCFNFLAARRLTRILQQELQVKSLRQLYEEIPHTALALPDLGVFSLATLGAAFEAKGIGGNAPLDNYVKKHAGTVTTFHTMKKRQQEEDARERKERRQRTAARRNQAHGLRIARFETRQQRQAS